MIACPNCGAENPAENRFCGDCGSSLAVTCDKCGAENPHGKKFCGQCGTALVVNAAAPATPIPSAALAAERRLVSVLFTDLVGFTTASEGRDAEDTRELLSRYFEFARERGASRLVITGGGEPLLRADAVLGIIRRG